MEGPSTSVRTARTPGDGQGAPKLADEMEPRHLESLGRLNLNDLGCAAKIVGARPAECKYLSERPEGAPDGPGAGVPTIFAVQATG